MANSKISALTELTNGNVSATGDYLPIADTSATETKKVTPDSIVASALAQTTANTVNGPTAISVNSATTALRVTQTGAGNALVVEDSANPDSTPFVIDPSGLVLIGTTSTTTSLGGGSLQVVGSSQLNARAAAGPQLNFGRVNTSMTAPTIVANGDRLGITQYFGYDGATGITAASIEGLVDGTPGTNDMPGRLVFSTTADGASLPTERMRIDSAGNIGIGAAAQVGSSIWNIKNITGSTTSIAYDAVGTIQSDVTSSCSYFRCLSATAASAFTINELHHYDASQSTIGAGSAITSQFGVKIRATLTGATNNYAFHASIPAGTGRWNFYGNGTARNYFAGGVEPLAGTTTQAAGFVNISAAAGVPTGVPTNPTGNVPLYYDTTNNKLYVYNSGWKSTAALT